MQLQFRNVVTLLFVIGFLSVVGLVGYTESDGFTSTLADSQVFNILIGALIGSVASIVAFLYKAPTANGDG